ncbi:hypothetical protein [Oligoflexus tunisiensis]|uniref:hypothetical protein n=1 Tax=Oligoflexus tunisiensis TaxID=708132 RepID=UPI00114CCC68|nr:hypothetical protein [Oligoflexus tunisiensis]
MHPIEAAKQRQYKWWLDVFLPDKVHPSDRHDRYRLGMLVITLFASFLSSLIFAIESQSLPIDWAGKMSIRLLPLVPLAVLLYVRWTGRYRYAALAFSVLANPLVMCHYLSLETVYSGVFYWIPWIILFVNVLSGPRQGLVMAVIGVLTFLVVLHGTSVHGHSLGIFTDFDTLYKQLLLNQVLAALAISAMMFTFALYNDRMESELEGQHVLRAQTAHKSMIGEMLGNLAHEVNNPLAIVHSALVHYHRLLETGRLDKRMQHGLVERMIDALDRLWRVVQQLNSSGDWSDLEVPRSHASLQPELDRPPQFGNSRLMPGYDATPGAKHRRHPSLRRFVEMASAVLDAVLPPSTRSWSTSQRFRARTTALICIGGMVAAVINLIQQVLEGASDPVLVTGYIFTGVALLGMLALKFVARPQIIGVGFIFLLFGTEAVTALTMGHSVLMPALHWLPVNIAALFLVARPRIALSASLIMLAADVLLMQELMNYGFTIAFGQSFHDYVLRMQSTMFLTSLTILWLALAFISLMNSTYGELVAEKDWQLLSARLREVNELADSAAILIGEPLRELGVLLGELQADGHDRDVLTRMQALVDRINGVSQSFALLSRPKHHEDIQTITVGAWLEHIHNICLRRAAEAGWNLQTLGEPPQGVIEGPLGRLTMLVITSLKEAFGHRAPQPGSPLHLHVSIDSETIAVRIQFADSPRSSVPTQQPCELEEALRLSLLQELVQSLGAAFTRQQQQGTISLELRWNQANLRRNLPL